MGLLGERHAEYDEDRVALQLALSESLREVPAGIACARGTPGTLEGAVPVGIGMRRQLPLSGLAQRAQPTPPPMLVGHVPDMRAPLGIRTPELAAAVRSFDVSVDKTCGHRGEVRLYQPIAALGGSGRPTGKSGVITASCSMAGIHQIGCTQWLVGTTAVACLPATATSGKWRR